MTKADYEYYDCIIAMDRFNLKNMKRFTGTDERKKVSLMMDYTDRCGDVADPWYTGDFETTWNDICEGCRGFLDRVYRNGSKDVLGGIDTRANS